MTDEQAVIEDLQKREHIARRKYANFISKLVIDLGLVALPVYTQNSLQGEINLVASIKFLEASDEDLYLAKETLDEADRRYKERKARKESGQNVEVKVNNLIGDK